jgi:hypothetical protein
METVTIDRIEGDIAVCEKEDLSTVDIPLARLPKGVKPGNVLVFHDDGSFSIDEEEESRRRKRLFELYNTILDRDNPK